MRTPEEQQLDALVSQFQANVWPDLRGQSSGNGNHRCQDGGTRFDLDVLPPQAGGRGYVKITCDPPGKAYLLSVEIEESETDSSIVVTYTSLSSGVLNAMQRVLDLWGQGQFARVGNGQRGRGVGQGQGQGNRR